MAGESVAETRIGYLAEFGSPELLLDAVSKMQGVGYTQMDAFTPFPVDGLAESLGCSESSVPRWMLVGGIVAGLLGWGMQYFSAVIDYPILSGGKPLNSWPAFIPVTFEMIILGATVSGLMAVLILNSLPQLHHPLFAAARFECASRDRFLLFVSADDQRFEAGATRKLLLDCQPEAVEEVAREV
ncbi:MAG: DUF3341 domain-containing protein [Pseudohongiellaceae bacterium]